MTTRDRAGSVGGTLEHASGSPNVGQQVVDPTRDNDVEMELAAAGPASDGFDRIAARLPPALVSD
ncbi:MAG: hypothetical protein WAL22_17650 [Solirubrobacteraceae bacterium]